MTGPADDAPGGGGLTLMVVHAHPDDEAISTGGVLARYADEGVRTVLVTCTEGELGDGPLGVKPGEPGHREDEVVRMRRRELERSCQVLGVGHLERLGYHDSGMMGWEQNDAVEAFWRAPVGEVAARLAALIGRYRPQVVVTYDENGFYGHPDHIQAHRVTLAAVAATGVPDKVYYPAVSRSQLAGLSEVLRRRGVVPPPDMEDLSRLAVPDDLLTTVVDCSGFTGRKRQALAAHASQSENIFLLELEPEVFSELLAKETFVRAQDRTGAPVPEGDLFAGLR